MADLLFHFLIDELSLTFCQYGSLTKFVKSLGFLHRGAFDGDDFVRDWRGQSMAEIKESISRGGVAIHLLTFQKVRPRCRDLHLFH